MAFLIFTSIIEVYTLPFWLYMMISYAPGVFVSSLYSSAIGSNLRNRIPKEHIGKYYAVNSLIHHVVAVGAPFY